MQIAQQEEVPSGAQSPDDSRQELGGAAVPGPDSALFPALLTALAAVSTVLVLLTALLLRRLARGGKRVAAPATPGAAHYLQQQHTYSHHQQQQQPAQLLKKNIYEVPKVEPIYSTPIEIFYPSSPSSLSTASSECEALQRPHTLASSTPRAQADTLDSYKSPRMQKFEDLVTFSPIYSYFSPAVEPKYSNIV